MKYLSIIAVLIVILCIIAVCGKNRENFTIAKRDGLLCRPLMDESDDHILPNSSSIVIQGYNYQDTPKIYRDGKKIVPLKYARDYLSMAYFFVVADPRGFCNSEWLIETTDYVKPVVNDGRSGRFYNVELVRRRNMYNLWSISC